MGILQRSLIAVGITGVVLHAAVLVLFRGAPQASLFSNLIQFVLALAVILACYDATFRSGNFGKRVWQLVTLSFCIYAAGQALIIWYDNISHASLMTFWFSSPLLFFWILPLLLASVSDPLAPKERLTTFLVLDSAQLVLLAITAYVAVFALPSQWAVHGNELELLEVKVRIARDTFVLLALVLRFVLSEFQLSRSFYRRLTGFMFVYAVGDITYLYLEAYWGVRSGTLLDLVWSIPRLLLIVLAVTWNQPTEDEFKESRVRRRSHYLHLAPVIVPIFILLINDGLRHERPFLGYSLDILSFMLAGVRLLLSQRDRERMISAISQANALFTSVIEGVDEAIYIRDLKGKYILINSAGTRFMARPREEIIGKTDRELLPPSAAAIIEATDRLVISSRQHYSSEEDIEIGGVTRRLVSTKSVHLSPEGEPIGVLGVSIDVSDRRKMEEHLQRAQRMESIGTFSGGLAHDFNNLLTVILGYSDLLISRNHEPEAAESLQQIHDAASRAAALTRQLLAFSRRQVLQPRIVQLNSTITNLHKMLARLIGEDVRIRLELESSLGCIKIDESQIEQVLMNLAANSRDAMPSGGTFTITTTNLTIGTDHPELLPGSYIEVKIEDNGLGIPPDILPRIFDPFFTTKAVGKGTGLGLATSYGIVTQSGGHITVESTPDVGTTFHLYFPRVANEASRINEKTTTKRAAGDETILLVEDDPFVRELAHEALRKGGYKILVAENADSAQTLLRDFPGPVHLLLTDLVMPGLNGDELALNVRMMRQDIKVIYMSGYAPETISRGIADSESVFVSKPFTVPVLLNAVRKVLDAPKAIGSSGSAD